MRPIKVWSCIRLFDAKFKLQDQETPGVDFLEIQDMRMRSTLWTSSRRDLIHNKAEQSLGVFTYIRPGTPEKKTTKKMPPLNPSRFIIQTLSIDLKRISYQIPPPSQIPRQRLAFHYDGWWNQKYSWLVLSCDHSSLRTCFSCASRRFSPAPLVVVTASGVTSPIVVEQNRT